MYIDGSNSLKSTLELSELPRLCATKKVKSHDNWQLFNAQNE